MKVSELKEILSKAPDNAEVILARDAEGNAFSPMTGEWLALFDSTEMQALMHPRDLTDEARSQGYSDLDCGDPDIDQSCIVLWPA